MKVADCIWEALIWKPSFVLYELVVIINNEHMVRTIVSSSEMRCWREYCVLIGSTGHNSAHILPSAQR